LSTEAQQHLQRALRLLAMVRVRAEVELPEVIAHTAYYSMHHAATAVLLVYGVAVPKTHSGLVTRLSMLDRQKALAAKMEVALLSRALDRRLIADYQAVDMLTVDHAKSARDDAIIFVAFCERLINAA
jgi:uncharacterized protein (UPF0332 family)